MSTQPPASRLPDRGPRAGDGKRRISNATVGVIALVLVVIGTYLAFTKEIPFTGHGYTLNATFRNGINMKADSPVRIAGVNVGKVIGLERSGNAATITFTVDDSARPVHDDAFVAIRPRIFFEGNNFLDLNPGTPRAPELSSGSTIPISHTSTAVQLDQILTALQSSQRTDLGKLLIGYGTALTHQPTASEDATQDPQVQGQSAAQALNHAFDFGAKAGRSSAQVTQAFQGTEPHDLSRLIAGAGRFFGALVSREGRLQDLITNFNGAMQPFAAQSAALSRSVGLLGPTLTHAQRSFVSLDAALPPLRRYAIELRPAVAELPATISAAEPWLPGARTLLSRSLLGNVTRSLERATPGLAGAQEAGLAALPQLSMLSQCTSNVLVPTGDQVINDQFSVGQPNYREFFYTTVNLAGESQNFDGNGPFLRVQPGGGSQLVVANDPGGNLPTDKQLWANTFQAPLGTQPRLGGAPLKQPRVECRSQPVPDLNGSLGAVGPPSPRLVP
jgi:phospholipid/cholesterol/gamma-HCH transport system substrate-binding protein